MALFDSNPCPRETADMRCWCLCYTSDVTPSITCSCFLNLHELKQFVNGIFTDLSNKPKYWRSKFLSPLPSPLLPSKQRKNCVCLFKRRRKQSSSAGRLCICMARWQVFPGSEGVFFFFFFIFHQSFGNAALGSSRWIRSDRVPEVS